MKENELKLIEQLANKLGTTSEYIWGVLLRQAPIDATVTLLQTLFLFFIGWVLWKVHKKLLSKPTGENIYDSYYDMYDIGVVFPMALVASTLVVMIIICLLCFGSIVSGYLNPEYWALNEVIRAISQ